LHQHRARFDKEFGRNLDKMGISTFFTPPNAPSGKTAWLARWQLTQHALRLSANFGRRSLSLASSGVVSRLHGERAFYCSLRIL